MLDIVLKILSIIGIVLLVLLVILAVALLLVLFFPVTYQLSGKKNGKDIQAWMKANWLFGLLRVRFFYPEPGNITVKALWFTLYDSSKSKADTAQKQTAPEKTNPKAYQTANQKAEIQDTSVQAPNKEETSEETVQTVQVSKEFSEKKEQTASEILANVEGLPAENAASPDTNADAVTDGISTAEDTQKQEKKSIKERILEKYEKIKYTIQKIYDKIKHILENIAFYKSLLQDEQTKGLLQHAFSRLGRILKSIRPRKLKGDILFGTGSPDTTGYAFGIYGMFIPLYGKHMNVTPDFTQAILEGELYAAGHITVFQLLRHGLMLLLDKRLRLLVHRIKTHTI